MHNTPGHTDAKEAEISAVKQSHNSETARGTCQTVENTEKISKEETNHQDTHRGYKGGLAPGIAHKDKKHAQIGKPDFDARNSGEKRNQGFQISKNDGKGGKKSEIRSFSGHGLCGGIHLGRGRYRFSFYDNFVWEADDGASFFCDGVLFHTEVIRTVGFGHNSPAVFDGAYIGIVYGNSLILHKRIDAINSSIYGDADGGTGIFGEKVKAEP